MTLRRMVRVFVIIAVAAVAALCAASLISGYSLVLLTDDPGLSIKDVVVEKGRTVHILKDLDLDEGGWAAYLVLGNDDWALLKNYHRNCYRITDKAVLNRLKQDWEMEITEGDVATLTSYIVFLKNGMPVWESGVMVTDKGLEGFQSSTLGWVHPVSQGALKVSLMRFEPVYAPLVIL